MRRYGIAWPDGTFTGTLSDEYRLAAAYAKTGNGQVYDSHNKTDPLYLAQCQAFGETP